MEDVRRGGVWRDPVLLGLLGVQVVACILFVVFDGNTENQTRVFWVAQVPLDAGLAYGGWRLRRLAAPRLRWFWTMIAFAGTSFTCGDTFQSLTAVFGHSAPTMNGGIVQTACLGIGMASNVTACMIFPQGLRTGRDKLIFWLDAATVLVGGGVLAWCYAFNPVVAQTDRLTASVTAALLVVSAFSATKVSLVPAPPLARIAAWPMVSAAAVQGVATFLPGDFQSASHPGVLAVRLLPSLMIAVGPHIQAALMLRGRGEVSRKRKPYSLLPYGMAGVTFVVFFTMLPHGESSQLWASALGVLVITGLVGGRQVIAFQDNMRLMNELRDHETLLREQASVDGLTRLANRTHFSERAARIVRDNDESAILLIDLDDFKTINDTMGHAAGDELLVAVAGRLREAVRPGDLVARLGGDEFAILLPGADMARAGRTADEILRHLAEPIDIEQYVVVTKASVGVASAYPGDEPSALLSTADIAMYEAKGRGKSTWVRYTDEMGARISSEAVLIRELGHAVENGEFALVYQPIVSLDDNRLTGVEALIRWNHPVRGVVSPVEFIPLAERTGQIVAIGRWALREACRQAAAWRPIFPDLFVGVNVAGRQLRTPGFVAEVEQVLAETGLPAHCLSIEVTETAVLDDEESHEALAALRGLGMRLALDDFGTAASSLGLLLTVPVTTLKLDRSFVESITTVGRQAAVANAVSQMANALDFASVAEGIETEEQQQLLRGLGYRYGQGYLYSRPLPAERITDLWPRSGQVLDGVVAVQA